MILVLVPCVICVCVVAISVHMIALVILQMLNTWRAAAALSKSEVVALLNTKHIEGSMRSKLSK